MHREKGWETLFYKLGHSFCLSKELFLKCFSIFSSFYRTTKSIYFLVLQKVFGYPASFHFFPIQFRFANQTIQFLLRKQKQKLKTRKTGFSLLSVSNSWNISLHFFRIWLFLCFCFFQFLWKHFKWKFLEADLFCWKMVWARLQFWPKKGKLSKF